MANEDDSNGQGGWKLSFAFSDQSPSYAHGFACGQVWQRMRDVTLPFTETVMDHLREDMIAMATAQGWREDIKDIGDNWLSITFTPERKLDRVGELERATTARIMAEKECGRLHALLEKSESECERLRQLLSQQRPD